MRMITARPIFFIKIAIFLILGTFGNAAHAKNLINVPEAWRDVKAPLPVVIFLKDTELSSGRDPVRDDVAVAASDGMAGGVLGSVLSAGLTDIMIKNQTKKADKRDADLRSIADGMNPAKLLWEGAQTGLSSTPWVELSGDAARSGFIDASNTINTAFGNQRGIAAICSYNISSHFHAIYARCLVNAYDSAKDNKYADYTADTKRQLIFSHGVEAEVDLSDISGDDTAREARWASNGGALLREGLPKALSGCGEMIGNLLELDQRNIDELNSQSKYWFSKRFIGEIAEHHGPIISGSDHIETYQTVEMVHKMPVPRSETDGIMILDGGADLYRKMVISVPN